MDCYWIAKREASAYQSVLDYLKTPNKNLIHTLTLLALDVLNPKDVKYSSVCSQTIVDVIYQQVFKVRILLVR